MKWLTTLVEPSDKVAAEHASIVDTNAVFQHKIGKDCRQSHQMWILATEYSYGSASRKTTICAAAAVLLNVGQ